LVSNPAPDRKRGVLPNVRLNPARNAEFRQNGKTANFRQPASSPGRNRSSSDRLDDALDESNSPRPAEVQFKLLDAIPIGHAGQVFADGAADPDCFGASAELGRQ